MPRCVGYIECDPQIDKCTKLTALAGRVFLLYRQSTHHVNNVRFWHVVCLRVTCLKLVRTNSLYTGGSKPVTTNFPELQSCIYKYVHRLVNMLELYSIRESFLSFIMRPT